MILVMMNILNVFKDLLFNKFMSIYKLLDWIDISKINWNNLSENYNAISILEKNIDKVDWNNLSENYNAISILEKNIDKVDWLWLSANINAIHILEKKVNKEKWYGLLYYFNIFKKKVNWYYL